MPASFGNAVCTSGVDIILGCNGLIWVAPHRDQLLAQVCSWCCLKIRLTGLL
jgi:exosome complex RNA-binding protein Rrp4